MKLNTTNSHSQYLPVEERARQWGLYVVDCGYTNVQPNMPYPSPLSQHPNNYMFSWNEGRTLEEYQLIYIARGRGVFESRETGLVRISAGTVFLVFPGVWHRFRPVKHVGWEENWIGFNGDTAKRIMDNFFSPQKAVYPFGPDEELHQLIQSVSGIMADGSPGYQQLAAARTTEALARIHGRALMQRPTNREAARKVQKARLYLAEHMQERVDLRELAKELGLSYSRLRVVFKDQTGSSPNQYLINIRINKAKFLLTDSDLPISRIADILGFSTSYYFSRQFRMKVGCTPSEYRSM